MTEKQKQILWNFEDTLESTNFGNGSKICKIIFAPVVTKNPFSIGGYLKKMKVVKKCVYKSALMTSITNTSPQPLTTTMATTTKKLCKQVKLMIDENENEFENITFPPHNQDHDVLCKSNTKKFHSSRGK